MAKPKAKAPTRTVTIACAKCREKLYVYQKGGSGALVKCFVERITKDFTKSPGICPGCGIEFAREQLIRGVPAMKIIGGKVTMKR